ncbi:MAG: aromatic amino acid lyase [Spirochaetaceae bacterium]|nr:MAG: aromatic amino acid lyase [Spirochaetaceae bacterium]
MKKVVFNGKRLTIEDIAALAGKEASVSLDEGSKFKDRINAGASFLDEALLERGQIYGVTTGYGDSCGKTVPKDKYHDLPIHLTRFHGCGLGDLFDEATTRAIIAVRLQSLCLGYSGVSYELLQGLYNLLEHDILPQIPQEGSVGASGDLTPLSYVAAAIIGERDVMFKGQKIPANEVFAKLGLPLVTLRPKEGLAIMNGTAAMTAVACLAYRRAEYLADLACRITSLVSIVLKGNAYHFDEKLFAVKPHPGQNLVAARIRRDLDRHQESGIMPDRIQDPYSIRCAPHVVGVFFDSAPFFRQVIENELNSANDNPIIDPESRSIMHGGHFYGGHIAFVMDSLKNIIANIADLMDRQMALIVDEKFNRGLPPNLTGSNGHSINHGFKAVQIGVSAWTAEALKNTMPASVFSRSTECHNQDKVSMGTISARDCIRVLELTEQVAAAILLALTQAVKIRRNNREISEDVIKPVGKMMSQLEEFFVFLDEDRPLENELRKTIQLIRSRHWILEYDK